MAAMPPPSPASPADAAPVEQVTVPLVNLTRKEKLLLEKCMEDVWIGAIAGSLFISAPVTGAMLWMRTKKPNLSMKKVAGLSISTALLGGALMVKYASEQCMDNIWNLPEDSQAGQTFRRIMKVNGYYRYSQDAQANANNGGAPAAPSPPPPENKPLPGRAS